MHIQAHFLLFAIWCVVVSGFVQPSLFGVSQKYGYTPLQDIVGSKSVALPLAASCQKRYGRSRISVGPRMDSRNSDSPLADGTTKKTIVAFTGFGDLRIHDNEALLAALSSEQYSATFVFDPYILSRMTDRRVRLLHSAVSDLTGSLERAGFPMTIRIGDFATEVAQLVAETGASDVYVHNDPVHEARSSHIPH
jgi:hypothetical protein